MSLAPKDGEGRMTGSGEGNRPFSQFAETMKIHILNLSVTLL